MSVTEIAPKSKPNTVRLAPGAATLSQLERVYTGGASVRIDPSCRLEVDAAAERVAQAAGSATKIFGINSSFGGADSALDKPDGRARLQRDLILSYCSAVGEPAETPVVRLMMVLKLLSLGRAASGVRWQVIELLEEMLARDVIPRIPVRGSIGGFGDFSPLAHMAAVMMGEGYAELDGRVLSGRAALREAGLEPIEFAAKEGFALVSGTQFSTACALIALFDTWQLAQVGVVTACLATEAVMGSPAALQREVHRLRGHSGQIDIANAMRSLIEGSEIHDFKQQTDPMGQDPCSIRCQPQVAGACIDLLRHAGRTLEIEANAVTDNLVVLDGADRIVPGGNCHAEPVAFAADQVALAIAELGSIAQRRVALLVEPSQSIDLPPFLMPCSGYGSGYLMAEMTAAALMSENRHLANPCSIDSAPTNARQEDSVSAAARGARRLLHMSGNLRHILGIELLCGIQGIEYRAPLRSSLPLTSVIEAVRERIDPVASDRYLARDLETASTLIADGAITNAAGPDCLLVLENDECSRWR